MNRFRRFLVVLALAVPPMLMPVLQTDAAPPGPRVTENLNKHNLSAGYNTSTIPPVFTVGRDSSITYKAKDDPANPGGRQICIFCHTPHNASSESPIPLWNRKLSTQTFSRYSSATLQIRVNPTASSLAQYGSSAQPDGASKLCLSCHDGVSQLGNVLRGGPITMDATKDPATGGNYISSDPLISRASFNPTTNKMKYGHHPVSFVYTGGIGGVQAAISSGRVTAGLGGGYGFTIPVAGSKVKLDKNNKMQCTTCHNAHQNQSYDDQCYSTTDGSVVGCGPTNTRKVVPFWVLHNGTNTASQDHDDVCISCHNMTQANPSAAPPISPVPWPTP